VNMEKELSSAIGTPLQFTKAAADGDLIPVVLRRGRTRPPSRLLPLAPQFTLSEQRRKLSMATNHGLVVGKESLGQNLGALSMHRELASERRE
jgi:hypothetical protein